MPGKNRTNSGFNPNDLDQLIAEEVQKIERDVLAGDEREALAPKSKQKKRLARKDGNYENVFLLKVFGITAVSMLLLTASLTWMECIQEEGLVLVPSNTSEPTTVAPVALSEQKSLQIGEYPAVPAAPEVDEIAPVVNISVAIPEAPIGAEEEELLSKAEDEAPEEKLASLQRTVTIAPTSDPSIPKVYHYTTAKKKMHKNMHHGKMMGAHMTAGQSSPIQKINYPSAAGGSVSVRVGSKIRGSTKKSQEIPALASGGTIPIDTLGGPPKLATSARGSSKSSQDGQVIIRANTRGSRSGSKFEMTQTGFLQKFLGFTHHLGPNASKEEEETEVVSLLPSDPTNKRSGGRKL